MRRVSSKRIKLFIILCFMALGLGGVSGYYAKPIGKFATRLYLSFKLRKSHASGRDAVKVQHSLIPLSSDPNQSVNTLIIGSDAGSNLGEGGYCRSDVMMLACIQERDKKAVVISIPRDTMVQIPGHGTQKINAAHAFSGPPGAIDAVKNLLGLDVHHFISIQFTGFQKVVNALGGIPIHLNAPINDPHSGYLPAGDLNLDGWQALVLVRSRNLPNGDIDRIKSQHAFLKGLIAKAETMKSIWKANQIVGILASNSKMDYSAGQLMELAQELRGFKAENIQFVTIPGDSPYINGVSYFVANTTLLEQVAREVRTSNWVSPELMAQLQSNVSPRADVLNPPNADVISVLSGWSAPASAVPTVSQELRLLGHQQILEGRTKQPLAQTTIYYRQAAKRNLQDIVKTIPELANASAVQDEQIPSDYNSPVVIVLGTGFRTPTLDALYGRLAEPALDTQNLGVTVHAFK